MSSWVYRITFAEGNTGSCPSKARIYDCLAHFRGKFGVDRVESVEERQKDGRWIDSMLLPMCEEEAAALNKGPEGSDKEYTPLSDEERREIEDWLDDTTRQSTSSGK